MPLTLLTVAVVVSFANFHVLTKLLLLLFCNATLPGFPTHFFLFSHKTHTHTLTALPALATNALLRLKLLLFFCFAPYHTGLEPETSLQEGKRSTLVTDLNATGTRDVRREAGPMSGLFSFVILYLSVCLCACICAVLLSRDSLSLSLFL